MPESTVSGTVGGVEIKMSTGKLATLADGAVLVQVGETEVLVTATAGRGLRPGVDFFPLTVDCEERMYAAGKIPGSFFRREGRPTDRATLTCRLIDRPLRPSFRAGFRSETHVVATILSVDEENQYDLIALNGASAALSVSPIPFEGPIGGVRLALIDGDWVPFPSFEQVDASVFEMVVAGTRNDDGEIDINMVEAGASTDALRRIADGAAPSDEDTVARGLEESKEYIAGMIDLQLELVAKVGDIPEVEFPVVVDYDDETYAKVEGAVKDLSNIVSIADKKERRAAEDAGRAQVLESLGLTDEQPDEMRIAGNAFKSLLKRAMRDRVVNDGVRLDGRKAEEIRSLSAEVGVVSRTHGTGLFQRGETQVLSVATLGMLRMEQMLDTISMEDSKRYMHHYNFPPFSTGETGFMRGPKRREIGHGTLAEKAVLPAVPTAEDFPYAIRVVSDVLTSNGSTSMASVCGSSLALMDAGVPMIAPIGGIAMGLIAHDDGFVTLTDILGAEDALGDMDFKVAGTADVITALQLDTKIKGLPAAVLTGALDQARKARLEVLAAMNKALAEPRAELNRFAPRIESVEIPKDKIGEIIGPKGKMIREIEEATGATLDIEDEGLVIIGAADGESLQAAKQMVIDIAFPPEVELGTEYDGEVVNITKFGAFINILPGRDGLLHISKIGGSRRIEKVEDELALGDKIKVVVREVDDRGKVSLDMAGAPADSGDEPKRERSDSSGGNGGGRGQDGDGGGDGDRGERKRKPRQSRDSGDRAPKADRGPKVDSTAKAGRTVVSFEDEFDG
ncbi:MAG: polyribonucleotide nucleotidyltransferase [Acidimicrobiia bacterium]|nr:polyribonucleotide nucleotidyltransferase [Acidimicrobiia bacterium]MDH3471499.1 polyribonucleotide nucleotidyltransferase [Acidimicrobiia bacterium]